MSAIVKRLRRINAGARHRLFFDSRMSSYCSRGTLTPPLARPGIAPAAFNSRLTQPLFTELANLLQNTRRATELPGTGESETNRHEAIAMPVGVAHSCSPIFWKRTPFTYSVDIFFVFPVKPCGQAQISAT